ncbi:DUF1667 domain-containing protein [candidate division KSB1 bacterium]|nr:DUF1667 domain-containing protein [candidate division KSB1 bacterium]
MTQEMVCISCPNGCRLRVSQAEDSSIIVEGNECKLGAQYAKQEISDPRRIVTFCIPIKNGKEPFLPVRTDKAVPKQLWREIIKSIRTVKAVAPITCGECLRRNLIGTDANVIATRTIGEIKRNI